MAERIVVIGAGVFGAWTAVHLQRAGHDVTLVDAWQPAHARASSGGESRLTRGAYGKDAIYTRMALDSLTEWKGLSAVSGLPIFHPCGVLFFFPSEEQYFRDSVAAHKALALPTEAMTATEMSRRFPMIDFEGIEVGLFEPGFGALMARRAVQTLVGEFVRDGGTLVRESVEPPDELDQQLASVRLASGETISADWFVFATGSWLPKLFPNAVGPRIRPTRQETFYFATPPGDSAFAPGTMPCWADFNDGDMFYGFPDLEGRGVKFAHDVHGPKVDPDTQSRLPTEAGMTEVSEFRDKRFPGLKGTQCVGAEVCQYENSSTGDFLIDFHPYHPNLLLVGGGSGHGFKHGPEVGRYAASLIMGREALESRFSLSAKTDTHNREVH